MKKIKLCSSFITFLLLVSCSIEKDYLLNDYLSFPVKFAKEKVTASDKEFSIYVPNGWKYNEDDIQEGNILKDLSIVSIEGNFIDVISIQKIKGAHAEPGLNSDFEYYKKKIEKEISQNELFIDSGLTNILFKEAYYTHLKSKTGVKGEVESISFLLESTAEGELYSLTASISQRDNYEQRMAMLLSCLKTFKILEQPKEEEVDQFANIISSLHKDLKFTSKNDFYTTNESPGKKLINRFYSCNKNDTFYYDSKLNFNTIIKEKHVELFTSYWKGNWQIEIREWSFKDENDLNDFKVEFENIDKKSHLLECVNKGGILYLTHENKFYMLTSRAYFLTYHFNEIREAMLKGIKK